ncbi:MULTISPECIES: hypothetical protein [Clostridium]|uniref:hypothetical protein n=1 Tax=Clostridium TaxID=1485 RepID=UPI001896E419|nr:MULTISPECIES: hypothetical protein [Clostridium]MDI9218758.1 hypothetical protein [Clostridium tertium]
MGLVIINIISYSIIMIIELLSEKRKIEKLKRVNKINRGDSIGSLILVLIGAGISAYACNNPEYTGIMRGIVITSFAFIYLIYWAAISIIDTKINESDK